jgi:hypothetical protein
MLRLASLSVALGISFSRQLNEKKRNETGKENKKEPCLRNEKRIEMKNKD